MTDPHEWITTGEAARMLGMQDELSERFGRSVDMGTLRSMRPYVRRNADRDLVTLYEVWTDLPGLIAQLRNALDVHSIT